MAAVLSKEFYMTFLNRFDEPNSGIIDGYSGCISQDFLEKLAKNKGIEFAEGYTQALIEITQTINRIIVVPSKMEGYNKLETASNTFSKIYNLHKALLIFMENNELNVSLLKNSPMHSTRISGW